MSFSIGSEGGMWGAGCGEGREEVWARREPAPCESQLPFQDVGIRCDLTTALIS